MRSSIVGGFVGSDTLRVPRIEGRSTECRGSGASRDLAYKPEGRGGTQQVTHVTHLVILIIPTGNLLAKSL